MTANNDKDACEKVREYCQTFFQLTGIRFYNFTRIFSDLTRGCLNSHQGWQHFLDQHHQHYRFIIEERTTVPSNACVIWDLVEGLREDPLIKVAREQFNIDHGICLIRHYTGFSEFHYFATSRERPEINQFYLNNMDVLQDFCFYFKEKAHRLIKTMEHRKHYLPHHPLPWFEAPSTCSTSHDAFDFNREIFDKHCKVRRYYLGGAYRDLYLSRREAECLSYLSDGLSAKEISKHMKISYRTTQQHLERIKIKFGALSRGDLLVKARNGGFDEIYQALHRDMTLPVISTGTIADPVRLYTAEMLED